MKKGTHGKLKSQKERTSVKSVGMNTMVLHVEVTNCRGKTKTDTQQRMRELLQSEEFVVAEEFMVGFIKLRMEPQKKSELKFR